MSADIAVAIVGAGPYGLSIASHLRAGGVRFRIFGTPMHTWRETMPQGMFLKSDGFASNISDPGSTFTLKHFCDREGIKYDDKRVPVALDTFTRYGVAFQQKMVPGLENLLVVAVSKKPGAFSLRLETGEELTAEKVIMAVGISYFPFIPPEFQHLPLELFTHSSAHTTADGLQGGKVAVIGAGASAVDVAAMLHQSGVDVEVIARHKIKFHAPPAVGKRSLWARLRRPHSLIGPGLKSEFFSKAPDLFRYLPANLRLRIVRRHLGPGAGWAVRDQVVGQVPFLEGFNVKSVEVSNGRVRLNLIGPDGAEQSREATHVIAATGYKVDLRRLTLLDPEIVGRIDSIDNTPVLSVDFESSVDGLYFVGLAAANTFGPLLRFACGADFAAKRISAHFVRNGVRRN